MDQQQVRKDIDTLFSKVNEMTSEIAVLENTNKLQYSFIEQAFDRIGKQIDEIKALLTTAQKKNGPGNGSGKGFWANMNDWKKPLVWVMIAIIGIAAWQGITLSEYLGAPIELGP